MNIREWLQEEPDMDDLVEINGAFTHPYEAIVRKLYQLCPDGWDTQNFQHQYFTMPDGRVKVSGSIEVVIEYEYMGDVNSPVTYGINKVRRVLSGAATFTTTDYSNETETNEHFAATVKSLAIVNAVQVLGRQFGWGLNSGLLPTQQLKEDKFKKKIKSAVKVDPDAGIQNQWNEAVKNKNMKMVRFLFGMYNITPGENNYAYINTDTDAS
mgnify:FL=1